MRNAKGNAKLINRRLQKAILKLGYDVAKFDKHQGVLFTKPPNRGALSEDIVTIRRKLKEGKTWFKNLVTSNNALDKQVLQYRKDNSYVVGAKFDGDFNFSVVVTDGHGKKLSELPNLSMHFKQGMQKKLRVFISSSYNG